MRTLWPVLGILAAALTAQGDAVRFDPPNPEPAVPFRAVLDGVWPNECVPSEATVHVEGATITILLRDRFDTFPHACDPRPVHYQQSFRIDGVPPGAYTAVVLDESRNGGREMGRVPVIVRDRSLGLSPYAIPVTGGATFFNNPFHPDEPVLTVDGVPVPTHPSGSTVRWAVLPPHPPGAFDVTLTSGTESVTAKAALFYYDPAQADPTVFEPILFPLSGKGAGAFGSQWETTNFADLSGEARFREPLPCEFCNSRFSGVYILNTASAPWGAVVYQMRETGDRSSWLSRLKETAHGEDVATDVPVIRERDFRAGPVYFHDLPGVENRRATLRVWTLDPTVSMVVVADAVLPIAMHEIPGATMWFGSLDLTSHLADAPTYLSTGWRYIRLGEEANLSSPASGSAPRTWAMLSITDNTTQRVTIFRPW